MLRRSKPLVVTGGRIRGSAGACLGVRFLLTRQCFAVGHKPIPDLARLLLAMAAGSDSHKEHRHGYPCSAPARRRPPAQRRRPPAIDRERRYAARNYDPLPVVLAHGDGCWLWDEHGRRYLDMMSAYSAVSHGHAHPRIVQALVEQAQRLAVTSRVLPQRAAAGTFCSGSTEVTGLDRALPANGGAEAVETALKAARKWGHKIKGIPTDRAEIIVCAGNFHGRSITIVGFSSEPQYRDGFGPFAPGFRQVPFGDADALARAIGPDTAAFLVEPIQGEGGIVVPPAGYLAECARICRANNVLLICDEIQTGMGRTGKFLASEHENVRARRRHSRQGARWRPAAGVGAGRHRRPDAGVRAGRPWQHVRGQSARRGGRSCRARSAVRRRA